MNIFDLVTFKELNKIQKQDEADALNVQFQKDGSLEKFEVLSWKDCLGQKAYAVKGYKYGLGSFYSQDYDTLEEALNFVVRTISTHFELIEKNICGISYMNDSRKKGKALEIRY